MKAILHEAKMYDEDKIIKGYLTNTDGTYYITEEKNSVIGYPIVAKTLKPCVDFATNWTLVGDKTNPKKDGYYLCTIKGELGNQKKPFTGTGLFEDGKWEDKDAILAWMPMPKPLKMKGEKK